VPPWQYAHLNTTRPHTKMGADLWPVRMRTYVHILAQRPPCQTWGMLTNLCAQHSSQSCCPQGQYTCNSDNLHCTLVEQQDQSPLASHHACPPPEQPPSAVQRCTPSIKEAHTHDKTDSCRGGATQHHHVAMGGAWSAELHAGGRLRPTPTPLQVAHLQVATTQGTSFSMRG
jgi:hypothetical protein